MTGPAPECAALAERLREVRARTGLSLVALSERTPYSKSSWERYLNGKKPAPWDAVRALCAVAGEPTERLLALWELADAQWSGRAGSTPPAPAPPPPAPVPGAPGRARRPRLVTVGKGVAAVAAALVVVALCVWGPGTGRPSTHVAATPLNPRPGCHGSTCDGKDPDLMSCGLPGRAEALGPAHHSATGAGMEIRYSPACAAAWGRIWHAKVGDTIEVTAPGARPRHVVISSTADADRYSFTPMIGNAARTGLKLCFTAANGAGRECVHS
jgi:hypothetical protein